MAWPRPIKTSTGLLQSTCTFYSIIEVIENWKKSGTTVPKTVPAENLLLVTVNMVLIGIGLSGGE